MAEGRAIIVYSSGSEEAASQAWVNTPHVASTLVDEGVYNEEGLQEAMRKAILVCLRVQVPIRRHFRRIHVRGGAGELQEDWALSDFAFYLLLLNGDAAQPPTAFAQAYAIYKAFAQR